MSQLRACKSATCRTGSASLQALQRASAKSEQHLRWSRRARRLPTILRMSEAAAAAESDGSNDKDDHTEDPFIVVVDMETSQTIESFIDQRVYIGEGAEKQEVLLCYPADVPVVIARFDDNDMLVQVTQTEQDAVFSTAASYLRYKGLDLINTAVCLTVQGSLEEDYSTKPLHMEDEDEGEMSVRVLAIFEHRDKDYVISEPVDPVLILATASEEAQTVGAPQVLAISADVDPSSFVFCKLLKGSQVAQVLPRVEKQLGRRFTQTYAGYGSSLGV